MGKLLCVEVPTEGPTVVFDTDLGRRVPKGMVLDFVNSEFRTLCNNTAPEVPTAAKDAVVHVHAGYSGHGHYNIRSETINVVYNGRPGLNNWVFRHETRHYLDHKRGKLSVDPFLIMGNVGLSLLPIMLPAGVAATVYDKIDPSVPNWVHVAAIAINGFSSMGVLSYFGQPKELRATATAYKERHLNPLQLLTQAEFAHQLRLVDEAS